MNEADFVKLALVMICGTIVGVYGYIHARSYPEGLPPIADGFFSFTAFFALVAAFVIGGRIGANFEMTTEGRVGGLAMATIVLRWVHARLGIELADWRRSK